MTATMVHRCQCRNRLPTRSCEPPGLRAGLLGFGIAALIGAFVMGGYALTGATRPQCAGECAVANPAGHWAWPTIVAAAALLGWFLLIIRTRRAAVREDRLITLTLVVLHVAALLLVWLGISKPWHQLRIALGAGPATVQLPFTIAAVVIGVLGALAVAVGAPAMLLDGARRRRLPVLAVRRGGHPECGSRWHGRSHGRRPQVHRRDHRSAR